MNKVGRNDPCPCGSGLKYKKCHGGGAAVVEQTAVEDTVRVSESARKCGWLNYPTRSYQRMLEHVYAPRDMEFWLGCARRYGTPVLCLCCGTGREAFYLAERGVAVTGVDVNDGFINAAQENKMVVEKTGKSVPAEFIREDIITMQLGKKFPLAIMATQSFELLLTTDDQTKFLKNLREHLPEGGVFVFNVSIALQDGTKFTDGLGQRVGTYASDLDRLPRIVTHGPLNQRLSTREEIEGLLRSTGFEVKCVAGKTEYLAPDFVEKNVPIDPKQNEYTFIARRV